MWERPQLGAELVTATLASGLVAHYWRCGAGEVLLYLRSFVSPAGDDAFVAQLAEQFDVVVPLSPGYADLDEMTELANGHDLALYYDDLLRLLGLEQVHVLGHSFGGLVATELAAHFPERVAGLALVAPFGLWTADEPTADLARLSPPKAFRRLSAGDGAVEVDEDDEEHIVAATEALTATLKFLWPFPDRSLARRLYRISAPTRIYWGTDDPINPVSYAARYAQAIDGATVEEIPGGHLLVQDQPAEMAGRIGRFLPTGRVRDPVASGA
jgi:pimeloyl-ACP methyl ester carboxylesterase